MKKKLTKTLTVLFLIAAALLPFFVFHDARTYLSHEVYRRGLSEDGKLFLDLRQSLKWERHRGEDRYCIENAYPVGKIEGLSLTAEKTSLSGEEFFLEFTLQNDTDTPFYTFRPVILEKKIGGKWYIINGWDAAFSSDAVHFPKNSSTKLSVDLHYGVDSLYREYHVDRGRYRAVVEVRSAKGIEGYIAKKFTVQK